MTDLTKNEEDYLKALFHLSVERGLAKTGTNQLAEYLQVTPASANNMLKKLKAKGLVDYEKYGKLELTDEGESIATMLVRKHRLWETFLQRHMNFSWDQVHDVAEQLEHIRSDKLVEELDKFLGYPRRDPHGAVIPTATGKYEIPKRSLLSTLSEGTRCRLVSVKDSSVEFLQYVSRIGLELSSEFEIEEILAFDQSMIIKFEGKSVVVSKRFADQVFVEAI